MKSIGLLLIGMFVLLTITVENTEKETVYKKVLEAKHFNWVGDNETTTPNGGSKYILDIRGNNK